jgi:hypothetical protein
MELRLKNLKTGTETQLFWHSFEHLFLPILGSTAFTTFSGSENQLETKLRQSLSKHFWKKE